MNKNERVLIVGAGFAGVKAALELNKNGHYKVTLLSDSSELRYYPTLYRTATGGSRANSSIPLSVIFKDTNVEIIKGQAETLDRAAKTITTSDGEKYDYDILLLCLGVVTNYFGIPGLDEYSYSIKTQDEVKRFKEHLHKQIIEEGKPDLNYVIIGAGPTGIELAGSLPSYLKHIISSHNVTNKHRVSIDLVEAMPRLLPNLPKSTSRVVKRRLTKLGIKLLLNSKVEAETLDGLSVNGASIKSHTVVWTAGVTNHPFFKTNGFVIMGRGKVAVDAYLQSEPNIYVLGDNANTPYSGMAQTALHDAEFVAKNLSRKAEGKELKSYVVKKPITVIPVGPAWAVVVFGKRRFIGLIGYLIREGADFRGFSDFEPWATATKQLLTEFISEDNCEICALAPHKD